MRSPLSRRATLAALLAIGLLTAAVVAPAQPAAQAPRIGFLWGGTPTPSSTTAPLF
jgi:hypothetical protein